MSRDGTSSAPVEIPCSMLPDLAVLNGNQCPRNYYYSH